MTDYPTSQEELEFHPYWHPCPACGVLVSCAGHYGDYYDQDGKQVEVPFWHTDGSHRMMPHGDNRYARDTWCSPKYMPLPDPPWWIKILKRLLKIKG